MTRVQRLGGYLRIGCAMLGFAGIGALPASADPISISSGTATAMVNSLIGSNTGITVVGTPVYTGAAGAAGIFTGGTGILPFDAGVALTTGSAASVPMPVNAATNPGHCPNAGIVGPNNCVGSGIANNTPGNANLTTLAGHSTFDAASLQFSFVPTGNLIYFQFVFGSEEYEEFDTFQNDPFAFYLNGVNIALIPGTNTPINSSTVNPTTNSQYYTANGGGQLNIQYDGLAGASAGNPFIAIGSVTPNQVNTIQFVIADVTNKFYDSGVLFMAGSFATNGDGFNEANNGDPIPEPGTWLLFGSGALLLAGRMRKTLFNA